MKFKFNIQPIIIEANSEKEAWDFWDLYYENECDLKCNNMEEID
jgi:hypothetical protein